MTNDAGPTERARQSGGGRLVERVIVTWVAVNAVFLIIWAMSGAGKFWPGWVMLLTAVMAVLRLWKRSMGTGDTAGPARPGRR